ncbi:hypothetical protein BDDG_13616 [Blastomyces dermatitidis ATCC 18188]|uniref:Uncharacterized protein n=1 Tax=Ajellomyces dermatitidis (strain ATCC 18188 / CBS 674.68) TaxID=653446 RepID=A0A0J9ET63_AJEDA|nr:hypothetical protein BDDG_13616 [Blastomyces dermatitidis ATCC 18188]
MHFMIQNIEKTALLSEHVNLLAAEVEPETADQKIHFAWFFDSQSQRDSRQEMYGTRPNGTKREIHGPGGQSTEKAVKRDFEMIIISDKKEKKKEKKKKKKNREALLSEHINLLITEMKPETADQKMRDFKVQIDLTERKQQKLFSEKAVKRDFEMIIISDEKKKKKKNEK